MRKIIASLAALVLSAGAANAAQLVLPSVVFTAPAMVSQTPVCTETAAASLVVPVAAGTVIFSCVVPPTGWVGALSFTNNALFSATPLSGNTFNIVTAAAVTTAQTVATGTVQTLP